MIKNKFSYPNYYCKDNTTEADFVEMRKHRQRSSLEILEMERKSSVGS